MYVQGDSDTTREEVSKAIQGSPGDAIAKGLNEFVVRNQEFVGFDFSSVVIKQRQ
jgi:hypothetical protein